MTSNATWQAWLGWVWLGTARLGIAGTAWQGRAGLGEAWHRRHGGAGLGLAWQGKASQALHKPRPESGV
jgi:hypothetical protein